MPLYEYLCHQCGQTFEKIQKFSDEPLAIHEACGGTVERLISAAALQFKGSGWYVTDYARNGNASSGSDKSDKKTKTDTKSETKTESKTESKPAASTTPSNTSSS